MKIPAEEYLPVHEKCGGCTHITDEKKCDAYINPAIFWRFGRNCTLASHLSIIVEEKKGGKVRVGQQKQKKVK